MLTNPKNNPFANKDYLGYNAIWHDELEPDIEDFQDIYSYKDTRDTEETE